MRNKKKRLLSLIMAVLTCCLTVFGGAALKTEAQAAEDGESYNLTLSIGEPVNSAKTLFYQDLADKTFEATNGGLKITIHAGGTLFNHAECYEGVLSGAADIGWTFPSVNPGQFPLMEIAMLPLKFDNQMALTYTLLELYKQSEDFQKEMSNVKVLNMYAGPMRRIFSSTPIAEPDDCKGLQIRSISGVPAKCLTEWGASPIYIGTTEIYDAMDKGVAQGFEFDWGGVKSNALYDVIDYVTNLPFYYNVFMLVMNKDSYDKIPEEYKATFDEIWCADQVSYDFAEMFAEEDAESQKDGVGEYGIQEIEPDIEKFTAIADKLDADWIAEHSNIDAQAYYDLTMKLYQEGEEKFAEK